MPTVASKNTTSNPADHLTVFPKTFVATDLTAVSKRPKHAAQKLKVINGNATTAQSVVFRCEHDAADQTAIVPFNDWIEIETPVKSLAVSGLDIEVHAYWWAGSGFDTNA